MPELLSASLKGGDFSTSPFDHASPPLLREFFLPTTRFSVFLTLGCWMNWPSKRELCRLPLLMQYTSSQELARKFNEDEAGWRASEFRRSLRSLLGSVLSAPDEDLADWLAAEREARPVRAVGFPVP